MRRQRLTLAVLVLGVAGTFASVAVTNAQPKLELTPFLGYYIASDIYNSFSNTAPGVSSVGLENSFMWGGRLTASGLRGAIEFAYTRTGSDIKLNQVQGSQPRDDLGRVNIDNYDLNFIGYQLTPNPRVTGFGLLGLGWAVTHPEIDSDFIDATMLRPKSHTLFNFNFGAGVKVEMGPKVSTRLEGRWRVMDTGITTESGIWCDPFGYCYTYASDWYDSGELIAGISYSLR
jgi:opacity protein-like surface antigen